MTLIRLLPQTTDLVITLNVPHIPEEENESASAATLASAGPGGTGGGSQAVGQVDEREERRMGVERVRTQAVDNAKAIMREVRRTVEVRDWGLFAGSE